MKLPVPNIQEGADVDLALTVETGRPRLDRECTCHFVGPVLKNLLLGDVRQSPYALDGVLVRCRPLVVMCAMARKTSS